MPIMNGFFEGILFGPEEIGTGINFIGIFGKNSGTSRVLPGTAVRYGHRDGQKFLAVTAYSMLAEILLRFQRRLPDEEIRAIINPPQGEPFEGVVCFVEAPDQSIRYLGLTVLRIV